MKPSTTLNIGKNQIVLEETKNKNGALCVDERDWMKGCNCR